MMKILMIAEFGRYGGSREAFKNILSIHTQKEFKTHVLIKHDSDKDIKDFIIQKGAFFTELPKREERHNQLFMSLLFEYTHYRKHIKEFKPDLIVASIGNTAHGHYLFMQNEPVVYILHTLPIDLKMHIRAYYKIISQFANKYQWICGVSRATVNSVINNWGYPEDQTTVLHNCYKKNHITDRTCKDQNNRITILTLGNVVEYKNPEVWLEVAHRVTQKYEEVEFTWLGVGALYEEFIKKTKDNNRINFPGFKKDVKKYYAKASIYFQPSKIENHSFSVLDAMSNAIPCVVSNIGGQPESVQEGVNGFLCQPNDKDCYIQKISKLVENSELREEMGAEGKRVAEQNFNPDNYNNKLFELYKKVLKIS
jgi:glycosyltransferase involved in cell wall biosynthesis